MSEIPDDSASTNELAKNAAQLRRHVLSLSLPMVLASVRSIRASREDQSMVTQIGFEIVEDALDDFDGVENCPFTDFAEQRLQERLVHSKRRRGQNAFSKIFALLGREHKTIQVQELNEKAMEARQAFWALIVNLTLPPDKTTPSPLMKSIQRYVRGWPTNEALVEDMVQVASLGCTDRRSIGIPGALRNFDEEQETASFLTYADDYIREACRYALARSQGLSLYESDLVGQYRQAWEFLHRQRQERGQEGGPSAEEMIEHMGCRETTFRKAQELWSRTGGVISLSMNWGREDKDDPKDLQDMLESFLSDADPQKRVEEEALWQIIKDGLSKLTSYQREVYVRHRYHKEPLGDIAHSMNKNYDAVKSCFKSAKKQMSTCLEQWEQSSNE